MSNTPTEQDLDQLIDCLLYRPGAVIAAQMREAAEALYLLRDVARAAKVLVGGSSMVLTATGVREDDLVALESALDAAGYGMTDAELEAALDEAELSCTSDAGKSV